mmetsp:Transcript_38940/g.121993  ORF Transcript_38940/g.121993 Transcript_38940/m.121993 type:complete len:223 (+) Transcript_38940:2174-2842(+)
MRVELPKSASLTAPRSSTRMLDALMSRWMTPCACRKSSPSRVCFVYLDAMVSLSLPKRFSSVRMEPPGTHSVKMCSTSPTISAPRYCTTRWCRSAFMNSTSRCSATISCLSSEAKPISFTAMMAPLCSFSPMYTRPKAPEPMRLPLRHCTLPVNAFRFSLSGVGERSTPLAKCCSSAPAPPPPTLRSSLTAPAPPPLGTMASTPQSGRSATIICSVLAAASG